MPLTMANPGQTVVIRKITGRDGKSDLSGKRQPDRSGQDAGQPRDDLMGGRNMKTLKDAKVGDIVTVRRLHGEGPVKRRIMDMGITKGVQLHVRKVAPLGDPMELNVRGYELSVRKADAQMIELE